ncbi:MAG TPA: ribosome silencing factor [Pyrinomonadaceae bacterium]|nr:ribosome silencing factor [Pyrinomonadaceae bacterium]
MKQQPSVKEQSLKPAVAKQLTKAAVVEAQLDDRIWLALDAASEKKALNSVVLDLRDIASFTDYFVITSGTNERQVQAISDEVVDKLKKAGTPVNRVEGYKSAEWILLDYGDFVMHIFAEKSRAFYDLERLWRESKRVELPREVAPGTGSSLRSES